MSDDIQPADPPEATDDSETSDDSVTAQPSRRRRRWIRQTLAVVAVLVLVAVGSGLIYVRTMPFGASPTGDRLARIEQSPEWQDGEFVSPQPVRIDYWSAIGASLFGTSDTATPVDTLDIAPTDTDLLTDPPPGGIQITWFGHSSTLLEIDGLRILIDPFWGEHSGPAGLFGATPFYPPPAALTDLGPIDAVIISHDHWDHLDYPTITAMKDWTDTDFIVPLGIGADLERWGIAPDRIVELDWWQRTTLGSVDLVATPARHVSGRDPLRTNETLWSGWALIGPQHRVWYSGDSGFFADIQQIGDRLGPFDVTLIESGQYDPHWPDNHFGPELAVEANALVGGRIMVPVHWGLFSLAPHSWTEPVERIRAETECRAQDLLVLAPGVPTVPDPAAIAAQHQWWPTEEWRSAAEAAVNPTVAGNADERVDFVPCVLGGR